MQHCVVPCGGCIELKPQAPGPCMQSERVQHILPVRVRSREKPSRFQSLMVLSEDVVASWRTSGLSRHFKM